MAPLHTGSLRGTTDEPPFCSGDHFSFPRYSYMYHIRGSDVTSMKSRKKFDDHRLGRPSAEAPQRLQIQNFQPHALHKLNLDLDRRFSSYPETNPWQMTFQSNPVKIHEFGMSRPPIHSRVSRGPGRRSSAFSGERPNRLVVPCPRTDRS